MELKTRKSICFPSPLPDIHLPFPSSLSPLSPYLLLSSPAKECMRQHVLFWSGRAEPGSAKIGNHINGPPVLFGWDGNCKLILSILSGVSGLLLSSRLKTQLGLEVDLISISFLAFIFYNKVMQCNPTTCSLMSSLFINTIFQQKKLGGGSVCWAIFPVLSFIHHHHQAPCRSSAVMKISRAI